MTDEEKNAKEAADAQAAIDAKAAKDVEDEAQKAKDLAEANVGVEELAQKNAQITKLTEERDNYKHVALKRLGKNPGDADFVAGADEKTGLTIEETVRQQLIERELDKQLKEKDDFIAKQAKENAELRLALKHRPGTGVGGGASGETTEVKDNVFSAAQIAELTKMAKRLNAKPEEFIQKAKDNLQKRS